MEVKYCPEIRKTRKYIQKIFQRDLDKIESDNWEPFRSYREKYSVKWIMADFVKNGKRFDRWELIPKEQYKSLLERFMEMGVSARIPDSVVDPWIHSIMRNFAVMLSMAKIYGRALDYPYEEIREFYPDLPDGLFPALNYMDSIGFFTPSEDPYTDAAGWTLYTILKEYDQNSDPAEKLILVNRCLDVSHWHGKMADKFLEGGALTADEISGK